MYTHMSRYGLTVLHLWHIMCHMMKESYFSLETVDEKSREMLQNLMKYRERHKVDFVPVRSALLVLDMQKYFLDKRSHAYIPSAMAIIPKLEKLIKVFLKKKLPVIFTRHLNTYENANLMAEWWKELITEKNPLSEICEELSHRDATVINKTQYDAFYKTPLEDTLKKKGVTQIVVTGVMTHLCCETTVRSAFIRGFTVFFPINGTATYNEDFHRSTFLNLSHGFAIPVLCEEIQVAVENLNER